MTVNLRPLTQGLSENGVLQGDAVRLLANLRDVVNAIVSYLTGNGLFSGTPALAISTNFDVATGAACQVQIANALVNIASGKVADTGTAATFPQGTWGVALVSGDTSGNANITWATNSSAGYASEAAAIAALPATPANQAALGYATVQAAAANPFVAGTSALQGGTGGNPAQTTHYFNSADPASVLFGQASLTLNRS